MQKRPRTAQPDAAALVEVEDSKAVLTLAVEIVVALMAGLDGRLDQGVRESDCSRRAFGHRVLRRCRESLREQPA